MTPHPQRKLQWVPYWITPPDIYQKLDSEFHFDFDPCPFPKPKNFDGLNIEWGQSNFVNPPFHKENGIGPTAFMKKAIQENRKGKTVVIVAPTQSYVNLMLEAGAELRSLGRIKWLHSITREPMKGPSPITAFILRATHTPAEPAHDRRYCWDYPDCGKCTTPHSCNLCPCKEKCEQAELKARTKYAKELLRIFMDCDDEGFI